MELAKIEVITDGGPWAEHNFPCPVCRREKAVLRLDDGTMHPCWACRGRGWKLFRWTPFFNRIRSFFYA